MFKHVTEINKKYLFQSPPVNDEKIKSAINSQKNRNCPFDTISTKSFFYPCKKFKFRHIVSEVFEQELEEITDRKIASHFLATDAEETQLSPYFPKYVNRVETKDVQTQTETCDLNPVQYVYSFYIEVVPILERLVGYTIELAITELDSEEEVLLRISANRTFNEIVAPERVEVNRRLEETYRLNDEIRRRIIEITMKEEEENARRKHKLNSAIAERLTSNVLDKSVNKLKCPEKEKPEDTVEIDIEENFLPLLFQTAYLSPKFTTEFTARICLDGIIRDCCDSTR